jgi:tripartite-type tricarboxylate transporter receptor subunit TctC
MKRQSVRLLVLGMLMIASYPFLVPTEAKEADYPTKPISFYISYSPGAATDLAVRPLLEAVGKQLGQPVVPINKVGGAGLVAAQAVMTAKPDGYTLGSCAGSNALIQPHLPDSPYKDLSGFTLICNYGKFLLPITVRADAPFKTWKEFIEWARKNPKRAAKIASQGSRLQSPNAMVMWEVEQREQVEFSMIVFKGSADSFAALLGGHITMDAGGITPQHIASVKEGQLRVLSYLGREKIPGFENVPSLYELYGLEAPSIMGVWGPKGIPTPIVDKLETAFTNAVRDSSFVSVMSKMNMPIVFMNKADVEKQVREISPRVGKIIKTLMAEETKERK